MANTAAPATAPAPTVTVGQTAKFKAYAELQEGMDPIFQPGDAIVIAAINGNDITITSPDGTKSDTAYMDEIDVPAAAAPKAAPRKAAAAKPAAAPAADAKPAAAAKTTAKGAAAKPAAAAPTLATSSKPSEATKAAAAKAKAEQKAKDKAEKDAQKAKDKEAAAAKKAADKAAKAPKVAVPQAKAEPEKVEIVNTQSLHTLLENSDALSAARSLIDQAEETFFTLGGVLAHIYHGELYKTLGEAYAGKQGWQLYVEKELGVGYRKAMHLIDIYQAFTPLEIDEKRLSAVGWSKAKEITRALSADNVEELLSYAEEHSKEEVIEYVKVNYPVVKEGSKDGTPAERAKKVTFKFAAFDDHARIIEQALEAAKTQHNTTDLGEAFYAIISEWAQLSGAVETTVEEEIARVEAKFGVQLGFLEPETEAAEGDAGATGGDAE